MLFIAQSDYSLLEYLVILQYVKHKNTLTSTQNSMISMRQTEKHSDAESYLTSTST